MMSAFECGKLLHGISRRSHSQYQVWCPVLGILLSLAFLACSDVTGPAPGSVQVNVTTVGGDLDEDGYRIRISGIEKPVGVNGSVSFDQISAGTHTLQILEVAPNCAVSGVGAREIDVRPSAPTVIEIGVACDVTGIWLITRTAGFEFPPFYRIDYGRPSDVATRAIHAPPNGVTLITRLEPGPYTLKASELREYCRAVSADELFAQVTRGTVTMVVLDVECDFVTGVVEIVTQTSGEDRDLDGFSVSVGNQTAPIGISGNRRFHVDAGEHQVVMKGVAPNCTVAGGDQRTVQITPGGKTQDTVSVTFTVTCALTEMVAFHRSSTRGTDVLIGPADGSLAVSVAGGRYPAWSPDRSTIAYTSAACGYYYYYYEYYCSGGVVLLDLATRQIRPLPGTDAGSQPTWSPDGRQIAFVTLDASGSPVGLTIIGADGSSPMALQLSDVSSSSHPAWSPDGRRIAFTCGDGTPIGNDICIINTDGSGLVRLQPVGPGLASDPAWSPDGRRMAFVVRTASQVQVAVMAADGSDVTLLGRGQDPDWSRDGSRIIFAGSNGLFTIRADGTDLTRITSGSDYAPAWRR